MNLTSMALHNGNKSDAECRKRRSCCFGRFNNLHFMARNHEMHSFEPIIASLLLTIQHGPQKFHINSNHISLAGDG